MKTRAVWFAVALLVPVAARADDWLAVLPACAEHARAGVPAFAFVYPRPGLPALVAAGDTLIARVRLPSPLTPPPGVQQPRALVGWRAALVGHALPWQPQAEFEQRHTLEVTNVRPDGASSLVYRASLVVPAWVAPGTYDLELSAPGGSDRAAGLVRVIAPGAEARLAWAEGGGGPAMPVDAWVTPSPSSSPSLVLDSLVAALRIGRGIWVIGDCGEDRRFADDVASVMAREKRPRIDVHAPQVAGPGYAAWDAPSQWRVWPNAGALHIERDADGVRVTRSEPGTDLELALIFASDGRGVMTTAGTLRFYPASAIDRAQPPPITAVLRLPAGASARLTRTPGTARDFRLIAEPSDPRSGANVQVRLASRDAQARVALAFDALHGAFARTAEHAYPELGEQRIAALAIAGDGAAVPLSARVVVHATQGDGCRCALAGTARRAPPGALWLAVLYLSRLAVRRKRAKKRRAAGEQE